MNYYDGIAPGYNQLYELEQKEKLRALSHILQTKYLDKYPLQAGTKILDVGCGSGISSDWWFETYGCTVTGIDPSKQLISQNTKNLSTFLIASAEELPFLDASFDIVVSITALQNVQDIRKSLQEIKRVSKGKCILTVLKKAPNATQINSAIHSCFQVRAEMTITKDSVYFIY